MVFIIEERYCGDCYEVGIFADYHPREICILSRLNDDIFYQFRILYAIGTLLVMGGG